METTYQTTNKVSARWLTSALTLSVFVASGAIAVMVRWLGTEFEVPFLADTVPNQAWYLIASVGLILLAVRGGMSRSWHWPTYFLPLLFISALVAVHLLFSPPPAEDAWNTPAFEMLRFITLHVVLAYPMILMRRSGARVDTVRQQHVNAVRVLVWSGVFFVGVAILQVLSIAPQFYYQWYGNVRLPRPTGGLEHPHFFAAILTICCCAAYWLRSRQLISSRTKVLLTVIYLAGIVISTSRVGLGIALVCIGYLELNTRVNRGRAILLKLSAGTVVGLTVILIAAAFLNDIRQTELGTHVDAFLSAFDESMATGIGSDEFLRGRGSRWAHEIDLITTDWTSLLFGYGHQPFVSHNLILRQLQVSGVIGTVAYLLMMVAFVQFVRSRLEPSERPYAMAPFLALMVASTTFPVLVSVVVLSALAIYVTAVLSSPGGHRC